MMCWLNCQWLRQRREPLTQRYYQLGTLLQVYKTCSKMSTQRQYYWHLDFEMSTYVTLDIRYVQLPSAPAPFCSMQLAQSGAIEPTLNDVFVQTHFMSSPSSDSVSSVLLSALQAAVRSTIGL